MDSTEERQRQVEQALGDPFFEDFPENTFKIRRNLIAISSIALFYKCFDLTISKESSFLGIRLDGLSTDTIDAIAIIVIGYLSLHFLVSTLSHLWEWRLRLSGMRVRYLTASQFEGEETDAPTNPRQSTFFWHLARKGSKIDQLPDKFSELKKIVTEFHKERDATTSDISAKVEEHLEEINKTLSSLDRTIVSLKRLDAWFSNFNYFQLFRWLLIEWATPLILAISATIVLIW